MADGSSIEVASVGSEGAVGLPALGGQLTPDTFLQVSHGSVQYISDAVFNQFYGSSQLGGIVDQYCADFMEAVIRLAGCNQMHPLEARCARWLAMAHERLGRANFELTQPFLAMALGANRKDLGVVLAGLASRQIIKVNASTFTILDQIGLTRAACSCYRVLKANLYRRNVVRSSPSLSDGKPAGNILPMRSVELCTLCGLAQSSPHKTHSDCLRAIDTELRSLMRRARDINHRRSDIAVESLKKFEKFLARRRS